MTESTTDRTAIVLGRLDPHGSTGFTRRAAIRRLTAEPALGLLLQHALVMELAHAKVGAGVAQHSLFEARPLRRGWSTADVGVRLVWGGPKVARAAAAQVYRFHDHVNGELPEAQPAWPDDDRYTAHDASLLLWVWATLVDLVEVTHSRWIDPIRGDDADAFYGDMCTFARFFGIPGEMLPPDRAAFGRYFESMITGAELQPTPTSVEMIRRVLWYRHWNVPASMVRPLRVLSIATLDPRIQHRFGLELSPTDLRLFGRLDRFLARWYRYRPAGILQAIPPLYIALRRPTIGRSARSPHRDTAG